MPETIEKRCVEKGLKMTEQRRVIARVLTESTDHPDVEMLYSRAVKEDAVGYHPVKSVFFVRFAQDLKFFSAMLEKLGGYNFLGREGFVFTLTKK